MASIEQEAMFRPKVLITADTVGGVWQYCMDLIGALQTEATFVIATMGPRPSATQRIQIGQLSNAALVESDYALEWMPNPWADIAASDLWLQELADQFRVDLVHLNGYSHAGFAWNKPVVCVAHSCVHSWWRAVHGTAPPPEWNEYKRRVTAGLKTASVVVAPSATMAASIRDLYGMTNGIQIIHNASAMQLDLKSAKRPQFLAAGRVWDEAKNLRMLANISDDLDWPIRIAGDGDGISSAYLGFLSRAALNDELAAAAVFLHPALYEPFGLAVLEAGRAGCCLVLSDIPSLRELWDGAALFVDPRKPQDWISELNRLAQDQDTRESYAQLAHERAGRFEVPAFRHAYLALYHSLTGQHQSAKEESAA